MSEVKEAEIVAVGSPERAEAVRKQIESLRTNLVDNMVDLGELLAEVKEKNLHFNYGYTRLGKWVEESSGLDMSERSAYYLIQIIEKSRKLGISKQVLKASKLSKLKEIFTLDADKYPDQIKLLTAEASSLTLHEVQEKVQIIAADGEEREPFTYITIKLPKSGKEVNFDPAVELVRKNYGDVPNKYTGEIGDVSTSYAIELICQDYLQDPNNYAEPKKSEESEVIPIE